MALEAAIEAHVEAGRNARLTAGYCWPWSMPNSDGTLVDDIQIDSFRRPWNAKPDARKLAKGIPSAQFWASDPGGVHQVAASIRRKASNSTLPE